MAQRTNDEIAIQSHTPDAIAGRSKPDSKRVLAQVADAFGLGTDQVDAAIRNWGGAALDAYDKGIVELYGRNYAAASEDLAKSVQARRQRASEAVGELVDASVSLAQSMYGQGKFVEAAAAYQESDRYRPDDPRILNACGLSLFRAGKYADANPFFERAITLREQSLGPDHPDLAASLNDFGILLHLEGDNAKAEQLYRRALQIREKRLGPTHPDVAETLSNLAFLLRLRGDLAGAEAFNRRALWIYEHATPREDVNTAVALNSLAGVLKNRGEYAEAEKYYRRALSIRETRLGQEHPDTLITVNDLAALLKAQGGYAEAERLFGTRSRSKRSVWGQITHLSRRGSLTSARCSRRRVNTLRPSGSCGAPFGRMKRASGRLCSQDP